MAEGIQGLTTYEAEGGEVERMYKIGGAKSLIGLEFQYRRPQEARARRVKLSKLNEDGDTYKGLDVRAQVGLVDDISPKDLTIGLASRRRGEDIVKLMQACDINPRKFIDPLLDRVEERELGYQTPQSDFERFQGSGRQVARSSPPYETERRYPVHRGNYYSEYGGGIGMHGRGGAPSPRPFLGGQGYGMGLDRGGYGGLGGRATPQMHFAPQVQHVGRMPGTPAPPEPPFHFGQQPVRPVVQGMGFGGLQPRPEQQAEAPGRIAEQVESLTRQFARAEQQRNMEQARSGITTEMRRMQTTISPVEHPGLYAVADQYATIHDCPPSHRGPMCLSVTNRGPYHWTTEPKGMLRCPFDSELLYL
jgi:hypothetical protein